MAGRCERDGVVTAAVTGASNSNQARSGTVPPLAPTRDPAGTLVQSKDAYEAQLATTDRKAPLLEECRRLEIRGVSKANLAELRRKLVVHWYGTELNEAPRSEAVHGSGRARRGMASHASQHVPLVSSTHSPPFDINLVDPSLRSLPPLPGSAPVHHSPPPPLGPAFELRPSASRPNRRNSTSSQGSTISDRDHEGGTADDPEYPPPVPLPLSRQEFEEDRRECASSSDASPEYEERSRLLQDLGINDVAAQQVLHFDPGFDMEGEEEDVEDDGDGDGEDPLSSEERSEKFEAFKRQTRVDAAKATEANRRPGGLQTQKGLVRFWEEFVSLKLAEGEIRDGIVDEHSILLFIKWNATRPKRTPRGVEMPHTLIGPSQLKKHFFSVFRIRKEQEACNPTLRSSRPIASDLVWGAIKTAMDKAARRIRSGLDVGPDEDAPDIIHNTFLDRMSQEDLGKINIGFLLHRTLRGTVNGHWAFCEQMATGNRGDDLRSLRLCEMQPYEMPHPNGVQSIPCALGLQGEEKAGLKGMGSSVNPVYNTLTNHKLAERCPMAALGFLLHYLFDVVDLIETEAIDFKWNKTFRPIRIIHSGRDAKRAIAAQGLFNLWSGAYEKGGVKYRLKQHLARHLLPYLQRQFGVPADETSRMGWKRGQSYYDTYAPALPKQAILAAHGFSVSEPYNPAWTHVNVPDRFLKLVCPMAEGIIESLEGMENMQGTRYFWQLAISLRPYIFQSAAAILKLCPTSALFKLPALAHPDVQMWMKDTFPGELALCEAQAGSILALGQIQSTLLANSLATQNNTHNLEAMQWRAILSQQSMAIIQLQALVNRRTQFMSPTQGFCPNVYESRAHNTSSVPTTSNQLPSTPVRSAPGVAIQVWDSDGIYATPSSGLRAYVSDSPTSMQEPRPQTQVDLVLPPVEAFARPGESLLFPPSLGCRSVTWIQVLDKIKQPRYLWPVYRPTKSLDNYGTVEAVWTLFTLGEPLVGADGVRTGMKPPLFLLEEMFPGGKWRSGIGPTERKTWQRFREIPEWITAQAREQGVPPTATIESLEKRRREEKLTLNGLQKVIKAMREDTAEAKATMDVGSSLPSEVEGVGGSTAPGERLGGKKRRAQPRDPRRKRRKQAAGSMVVLNT